MPDDALQSPGHVGVLFPRAVGRDLDERAPEPGAADEEARHAAEHVGGGRLDLLDLQGDHRGTPTRGRRHRGGHAAGARAPRRHGEDKGLSCGSRARLQAEAAEREPGARGRHCQALRAAALGGGSAGAGRHGSADVQPGLAP